MTVARRAEAFQLFTGSQLMVLDAIQFSVKSSFADLCSVLRASDDSAAPTLSLLISCVNRGRSCKLSEPLFSDV